MARPDAWAWWLDATPRPAWQHMAIDAALLARAADGAPPVLRVYTWAAPSLTLGRHEPAQARYRADRLAARGIAVVRRLTGGRAVWHRDELTYAFAAPAAILGGVRATYDALHAWLRTALAGLGLAAELAPVPPAPVRPDAGPCFRHAAGGELLVAAHKVVGSAQARSRGAVLQEGHTRLAFTALAPAAEAARGTLAPAWVPFGDAAAVEAESEPLGVRFRDPAWTWSR